jgi:hypothetical protein
MPVFALEQAWHIPIHALLQHTPSTQLPLKHTVAPAMGHACPVTILHTPTPSHETAAPVHAPSSVFNGTFEHVPSKFMTLHALHSPVHVSAQQTPSMQLPLKHSMAPPHTAPRTFLQVPMPSHWFMPLQMFAGALSWVMAGKLLHVPSLPATLHDLHAALQLLLQHTLSAQALLKQASFVAHG